ncbi:VOC family protein [Roseiarcaceae bacterium H3SJ34-1]|uniref:VOC family protein n=1 Tax=Terripilifer ovatus TaxID=3032367 RepID=UPI003AB94322|nr:VOC family protein [Roseiarcaceae bacterium H3SJ34-1]
MALLNFGQPLDGVVQTAFIVKDVHAAMREFTRTVKAGPWFLREGGRFATQTYRGKPTDVELSIAMGCSGTMQYELIQQLNDVPSVYKEIVDKRGYGFHHFGVSAIDYSARIAEYKAQGFELVYEAEVPSGARVGYFDTVSIFGAMIEVIEMIPVTEDMFTQIQKASVGWDGSDPVRQRLPLKK